ncbi:hypothetical protein BGZ76_007218 [Entomortierella beljakovae]|nr:hypothetical protein BGZ76_007218 [Entomortierella beljakovae]
MSSSTTKFISGIQERDDVRVIPMSRRADGSIRKERKVRPGYTPPEDVAKYTNRVLDAARPANSISSLATPIPNNNSSNTPKTKAQIKNEKRKAKRKEDGATDSANTDQTEPSIVDPAVTTSTEPSSTSNTTTSTTTETEASVDPEKKLRALNKKLRQAQQLKEKQDNGEELLSEQLEKVSKINELMDQIAELKL